MTGRGCAKPAVSARCAWNYAANIFRVKRAVVSAAYWGSVAAVWRDFMRWIDGKDRCCRATGHTAVVRAKSGERPRPVRRRLDIT